MIVHTDGNRYNKRISSRESIRSEKIGRDKQCKRSLDRRSGKRPCLAPFLSRQVQSSLWLFQGSPMDALDRQSLLSMEVIPKRPLAVQSGLQGNHNGERKEGSRIALRVRPCQFLVSSSRRASSTPW